MPLIWRWISKLIHIIVRIIAERPRRAMEDEIKKREQAREAKKKTAKTKYKDMARKWERNEELVRTHWQSTTTTS